MYRLAACPLIFAAVKEDYSDISHRRLYIVCQDFQCRLQKSYGAQSKGHCGLISVKFLPVLFHLDFCHLAAATIVVKLGDCQSPYTSKWTSTHLHACTSTHLHTLSWASPHLYAPPCTSTYLYALLSTSMHLYVPLCISSILPP